MSIVAGTVNDGPLLRLSRKVKSGVWESISVDGAVQLSAVVFAWLMLELGSSGDLQRSTLCISGAA